VKRAKTKTSYAGKKYRKRNTDDRKRKTETKEALSKFKKGNNSRKNELGKRKGDEKL
jgi:hypothetical protein